MAADGNTGLAVSKDQRAMPRKFADLSGREWDSYIAICCGLTSCSLANHVMSGSLRNQIR